MVTKRRSGRLPPLNALRAFETSGRTLNFRLAAEEMALTQGAVAQQVRYLEDVLQVRLFERLPRGLALTSGGQAYHAAVTRALDIIAQATDTLTAQAATVTISTTPSFASKWLLPRLSAFSALHPAIEVRLMAAERLATFGNDGVDLSIRHGTPPFDRMLHTDLLFPVTLFAVCSPDLLQGATPLRQPADLASHVLLHDGHDQWRPFLAALLGEPGFDTHKGPRFNQSALAIDAAIAGQGVALGDEPLVEGAIAAGKLVRPFAFSMPSSAGYYILRPAKNTSQAAETMREWLLAESAHSQGC